MGYWHQERDNDESKRSDLAYNYCTGNISKRDLFDHPRLWLSKVPRIDDLKWELVEIVESLFFFLFVHQSFPKNG